MTKKKDMANTHLVMEMNIMEIGKMTKNMVKVYTNIQMVIYTKVNLKTMKKMEWVK